jgi:Endoribonuclease XendoU
MWFSLYRREVQNDSSGFEHVFLGESDNGQVKVSSRNARMGTCRALSASTTHVSSHHILLALFKRVVNLMVRGAAQSATTPICCSDNCLALLEQGLHSWIQYHLEERNGNLEYRGYLHPKAGPKASPEDRVISVHFGKQPMQHTGSRVHA